MPVIQEIAVAGTVGTLAPEEDMPPTLLAPHFDGSQEAVEMPDMPGDKTAFVTLIIPAMIMLGGVETGAITATAWGITLGLAKVVETAHRKCTPKKASDNSALIIGPRIS